MEERDASQSKVNSADIDTRGIGVSEYQLDFYLSNQDSWQKGGRDLSSKPDPIKRGGAQRHGRRRL
ncbi:hypothetical protein VDIAB_220046 [Vibrio diabolicus]|nr:hypothetical protein VDIAB_220046 [Vibrio diabolicus]